MACEREASGSPGGGAVKTLFSVCVASVTGCENAAMRTLLVALPWALHTFF
jgi:hypothetical protein